MATKPRNQWGDALLHSKILQHMHGVLFHLTDCAHADSINEHGLLSKREASARGICPTKPGGNVLTRALDSDRGVDDDVFLSFHRGVVMPNDDDRERQPLVLHIDPSIVFEPGVRVSLGRSTGSEVYKVTRAFHEMDWDIFHSPEIINDFPGKGRWIAFLNYEVLVPKCVPRQFIIGCDP